MMRIRSAKIAVAATLEPLVVVDVRRGFPKLGISPSVVLRVGDRTHTMRAGDQLTLDVKIDAGVGP